MGAVVVDLGAGTTTLGVFAGGRLVHADGVAVGGNHVTLDVARGLSTRLSAAERLKTLYGSTIATASDERETIAVPWWNAGDGRGRRIPSASSCASSGRGSKRSWNSCATG